VVVVTEPNGNLEILILMDLSSPNFNDGSISTWGFCDGNFKSNLLCTTKLIGTW